MYQAMKSFLKITGAAALIFFLAAGCFRNDIRTEVFEIDQLRSPEASAILTQALRPLAGIMEIHPDPDTRRLTVVFNGREVYLKNIEHSISKAGFDLPNRPAAAKDREKLPADLRT